jgi:hypothetical protein
MTPEPNVVCHNIATAHNFPLPGTESWLQIRAMRTLNELILVLPFTRRFGRFLKF